MKTRYFVSDDCTAVDKDDLRAELILVGAVFKFKERKEDCGEEVSDFFCYVGGVNEKYITKVEEMELSDFIADGRTKYELNGIRFVVNNVVDSYIDITCDKECLITELCGNDNSFRFHTWYRKSWSIVSRDDNDSRSYHSHIEDIKLVTTCGQCGKYEVMDNGKCYHCTMESELMDKKMCEHDEIVYTSSQYIEAIEKEVPELKDVRNKYDVQIVGKDGVKTYVDVYRVMTAFNVKNAALQHANKKILKAGERGHKNYVQDLKEAIASIELAIIEWEQTNV